MISIEIKRSSNGLIKGFRIQGHAGYSSKGKDIVCAAVSAIAYTAVGALDEMAGIKNYTEKDGFMEFGITSEISGKLLETANIIMNVAAVGFKQIEYSYGKYVRIVDKEV